MEAEDLPVSLNLFDYAQVPDFDHWDQGISAEREYEASMQSVAHSDRIRAIVMWILIVVGIIALAEIVGILFLIGAFLIRKNSAFGLKLANNANIANSKLNDKRSEYAELCTDKVGKKLMIGQWSWFRAGNESLIYSDQRFAYLNTDNGALIAYNNSNIKEVTRERVHTGSHVTSSSNTVGGGTAIGNTGLAVGGGQTSTNSETTDYYQWHFDILTDFLAYPKVSFVLMDSPSTEDLIGKAYAILKP